MLKKSLILATLSFIIVSCGGGSVDPVTLKGFVESQNRLYSFENNNSYYTYNFNTNSYEKVEYKYQTKIYHIF